MQNANFVTILSWQPWQKSEINQIKWVMLQPRIIIIQKISCRICLDKIVTQLAALNLQCTRKGILKVPTDVTISWWLWWWVSYFGFILFLVHHQRCIKHSKMYRTHKKLTALMVSSQEFNFGASWIFWGKKIFFAFTLNTVNAMWRSYDSP